MSARKLHPAAAMFPMLSDDDLDALAADIKANGQREPITCLPDGTILDGRNRLEACRRARVRPTFTTYEGDDPAAFVLSANIYRRHLTTGQRAAAVALVLDQAGKRTNGRWARGSVPDIPDSVNSGTWRNALSQAGVVLDHLPDALRLVFAGGRTLDAAYNDARSLTATAETETERLERLREAAPDLAELVAAGDLSLSDARAVVAKREAEREAEIRAGERAAASLVTEVRTAVLTVIGGWKSGGTYEMSPEDLAALDEALALLREHLP